ncbi:MAG: hypothetical protein DSZ12_00400 [Sulfurovum sp.]|nr:MAG: hypothetical protein DSZ12_00400 [Sulfurovum sp.]
MHKHLLLFSFFTILLTQISFAMPQINGNWHIRVIDGMDVRKARAILDFDMNKSKLTGFDGCNRISATLVNFTKQAIYTPNLLSTNMACRTAVHTWTRKRLHETLKESFYIKKETKYGIEGITIKSVHHELFLKKMARNVKQN